MENNGLGIDGVDSIYPVFDERNPRKTPDSKNGYYQGTWAGRAEIFEECGEPFDFN